MQVGSNSPVEVNHYNGTTDSGVTCIPTVEQQGEFARICYTVTNSNESDVTVSIGTHADVMIGDNDRAPISRRIDTAGNTYGLTMKDGNGAQLCILFGAGLAGVNAVSDYWFGYYSLNNYYSNMVGNYNSGSNYMEENGSYDSGMGWCWKNRIIPAGGTIVFSYLIGVGEVNLEPNSSFFATPDDPDSWNDLSIPHKIAMEGTYESPAGVDGKIEYAIEDSEEWHTLTDMMVSGSAFCDTVVAVFDPNLPKHHIRFRTVDNVGNTTILPSIEYVDVTYHEYTGITDKVYSGDSIYQNVECATLASDLYTTTRYQNNVNVGNASFCVEGVFPYTIGRKHYTFKITPVTLAGGIELDETTLVYNGNYQTPEWNFTEETNDTLVIDRDFRVAYSDNIYPGTAKVIVTGIGNYTGTLTKEFYISKAQLSTSQYSVTLPSSDINYDEQEHIATSITSSGVGAITFAYTKHGETEELIENPKEEGSYDIYMTIADGDYYFGQEKSYLGTFTIYSFDDADWATLQAIYSNLDGENWINKWDLSGGKSKAHTFYGVKVSGGHVIELSLPNNGLSGTLTNESNRLQNLTKLNVSCNSINGDLGKIGELYPSLEYLDVSGCRFSEISEVLPATISTVYLGNQTLEETVSLNLSDWQDSFSNSWPSIIRYDASSRSYVDNCSISLDDGELWNVCVNFAEGKVTVYNMGSQNEFHGNTGDTFNAKDQKNNTFNAKLYFPMGDVNFDGEVTATDLQADINYAFEQSAHSTFNFTAADTYTDNFINVQDVVCLVNILIGESEDNADASAPEGSTSPSKRRIAATTAPQDADAHIFVRNGKLILSSAHEIAALDIHLDTNGTVNWHISQLGMMASTKADHAVAYSLSGNTIPAGETVLADVSGAVSVAYATLSDADAQNVKVALNVDATAIYGIANGDSNQQTYSIAGYRTADVNKGVNIIKENGTTKKVFINK